MPSKLASAACTLAAVAGAYFVAVGLLTVPFVQRNAFYANRVNPTYFQDLSDVEQFGFFQHQVQPFTLLTPDNSTIYAWHIIPTHLYLQHEEELKSQKGFGVKGAGEVVDTVSFRLLQEQNAQVVISFHGNAAHLASSWRPITCQAMLGLSTPQRPVHVIVFDYRGFGLSTGWPTEEGIITDSTTLLSFLTGLGPSGDRPRPSRKIDPSHIVLLGQSLGTAISTGLYHRWALEWGLAPPRGLVLMASFASLPKVLRTYSMKGLTPPMLAPLKVFPGLQQWVTSKVVDKWETERRLAHIIAAPEIDINLTILHAKNDGDIPWQEGWENWHAAIHATQGSGRMLQGAGNEGDVNLEVLAWESDDKRKRLRWERVMHGGHNRIATSEQAKLAVLRILEA